MTSLIIRKDCECCMASASSSSASASSSSASASISSSSASASASISSSSSSVVSSSSSSSSSALICDCGCDVMCGNNINGKIITSAPPTESDCNPANSADFTLEYKKGIPVTDDAELLGGIEAEAWWRGTVSYCDSTWEFVVYCHSLLTGVECLGLRAYISGAPGCVVSVSYGDATSPIHAVDPCTCSPLSVRFGMSVTISGEGCCCNGILNFSLIITE